MSAGRTGAGLIGTKREIMEVSVIDELDCWRAVEPEGDPALAEVPAAS